MAKVTPGAFIRQVRQESSKVTWPTRKETLVTTGMVFVMVFLASMFFFFVDFGIQRLVKLIFSMGS